MCMYSIPQSVATQRNTISTITINQPLLPNSIVWVCPCNNGHIISLFANCHTCMYKPTVKIYLHINNLTNIVSTFPLYNLTNCC